MKDIYTIQDYLSPDIHILLICSISCMVLIFFIILFFLIKSFIKKKNITSANTSGKKKIDPNVIKISLNKLKELLNKVENQNIEDYSKIYSEISLITRYFITGKSNIEALNMTKAELKEYKIKTLDDILKVAYTVQFGRTETDKNSTINVINKSIELIEKWN